MLGRIRWVEVEQDNTMGCDVQENTRTPNTSN